MNTKEQLRESIYDLATDNEATMIRFLAEIVEQLCQNAQRKYDNLTTYETDFWDAAAKLKIFND